MGGGSSKPSHQPSVASPFIKYVIPPSPTILDHEWRVIKWGDRESLRSYVTNYKPDGAKQLRILLYGPVGAGKSSFVNSVGSALTGEQKSVAEANASNETTSFTVEYKTHRFKIRGEQKQKISIVFSDIMGLEAGESRGVLPKDIKLAMEGHVKEGYKFKTNCELSDKNQYYNPDPTINDKVHVLVCMLNADSPNFDASVIQKMKEIREAARDLGIPQVAVATHIDGLCDEIDDDIKMVFKYKNLKEKIEKFSQTVGIPVINIFPVRNNYEGAQKDEVDALLLTALKHMVNYGDDFIDDFSEN